MAWSENPTRLGLDAVAPVQPDPPAGRLPYPAAALLILCLSLLLWGSIGLGLSWLLQLG